MRKTPTHIYFWDSFLSNWHPAAILHEGIEFSTSEHLFMWLKAKHFKDEATAQKIAEATHPGVAKQLGRQIAGFNDEEWAKVRYHAMVNSLMAKFEQNSDLRKQLVEMTGNRVLVEASPVDKIWGVGLAADDDLILDEANWKGQNLLGKALMEVRNYFTMEVTKQ